ncbi:SRPBCC family protein [Flavobacterium sp. MAH-1]|uniref:SRPBCC family protein n=1 Tax=Flavobacterium agri TaxID=2743471 RepID=A0A7Y8XZM4_9FLAO|nr:SRPBCC family protein [Flavobacterium agri]NUY79763.1 SRPBCC family protein [Flavobacterium agri]NYA69788.1 SRPBCC family protein [Flavobacterium agri]
MKLYELKAIQKFPTTSEKLWDFIATPKNLTVITPPNMGFNTLSGDDSPMFAGQIIDYTITPLFGIRLHWVTEITHVEKGKYFVDEQRFGPYAFWHHKHFLKETDFGCEMIDVVHYKLPMGFLGHLAHPILVRPKLEEIFEFRHKKLIELFGEI